MISLVYNLQGLNLHETQNVVLFDKFAEFVLSAFKINFLINWDKYSSQKIMVDPFEKVNSKFNVDLDVEKFLLLFGYSHTSLMVYRIAPALFSNINVNASSVVRYFDIGGNGFNGTHLVTKTFDSIDIKKLFVRFMLEGSQWTK